MKAIVCHGAQDLRLEDQAEPVLGPSQVLVRVAYGGICGSDLHYAQHGGFGSVRIRAPITLGHEVSGTVAAVGAQVQGLVPGQRVAISPSRPCGHCEYCHSGQQNHCLNMRFYGSAMPWPHIQGAFSEQLVIEAYQAHPVRADLSLSLAALAEPLSVGLHAITRAGSVLGRQVLVTGCGPIGSLLIGALRRAGARHIVAADLSPRALQCARDMGADQTINLRDEPEALAPFAADKGRFDVVFEASGAALALLAALPVLRPGGVLVAVGNGGDVSLPLSTLVAKEIELRGTFRFHAEFATAVRFLNDGLIDGRPVITAIRPLPEALAAFALAADKQQSIKVQIAFDPALA